MPLSQWLIIGIAFFSAISALLSVGLLMQPSRHGRTKAALRDSEERYLLALTGSTDGLWDWDLLSETVFYSDCFREILGFSFEEFPATGEFERLGSSGTIKVDVRVIAATNRNLEEEVRRGRFREDLFSPESCTP